MKGIEVLVTAGCSPDIVAHCIAVSNKALTLTGYLKNGLVDLDLVMQGALYHDIGRSKTHDIHHALAGADIGRDLRFSEALIHIIERHIGAGITASEAVRLGLPKKDYLPVTREEKIVSYADNLISGTREMPFYEALDRFKEILGPEHEGVELFIKQHYEIQGWMK